MARRKCALAWGFVAFVACASIAQAQTAEALARRVGCFECHSVKDHIVGPAFKTIAARYHFDARAFELRFMSVASVRDLPDQLKSTVMIALVGDSLHIRIFDRLGGMAVDKGEVELAQSKQFAGLKERLGWDRVPDASQLPPAERQEILKTAASVGGYSSENLRLSLIEGIKKGGKGRWSAISKGVPMPPFAGRLTENEIARLVDWILPRSGNVNLNVLKTGLGNGHVVSDPPGIDCRDDCEESFAPGTTVELTATPDAGSAFARWVLDPDVTTNVLDVTMDTHYSIRAEFQLVSAIPPLKSADLNPDGIEAYLKANPAVNNPARFLNALPRDFKQNWILMSRSESLQTGTAEFPRILLPSADARNVFSIGIATHSSYPGAHPNAIEYMQWDGREKNFRFHEIVVADIPAMHPIPQSDGSTKYTFPPRPRSISKDDARCSKCHSTQNVLNRSSFPGTTGMSPPFTIKAKSKPNWDTYDSWGGMLPFNRDRIYQGSVEAAAFRAIFDPWTWRTSTSVRSILEQLELQPPLVPDGSGGAKDHRITQILGGEYDGHIRFGFDPPQIVLTEPKPTGDPLGISTNYAFNAAPGAGPASPVIQGGEFVTLHHSLSPQSDEGRGVEFFDILGGFDGEFIDPINRPFNAQRIVDELIEHRFATGGSSIDVRPIALAISKNLLEIDEVTNRVNSKAGLPLLTIDQSFFDARNGMHIKELRNDSELRAKSIPRRKADIQALNLVRNGRANLQMEDSYLRYGDLTHGLVQEFGGRTHDGTDLTLPRLRQEVFRRPIDQGGGDDTVMGGIYVDREAYNYNTPRIALFRYWLEPLGVSVDKWSMGVRGRSRTYTFADIFASGYMAVFELELAESLQRDPRATGLPNPFTDSELIEAVNRTLSVLPSASEIPRFTDVQRIFNRSCIECHGGLNYPPYLDFGTYIDLSEDESPLGGSRRLDRSHAITLLLTTSDLNTSSLYQRIINPLENCDYSNVQMMPCGGPRLSTVDVETIRRWIIGGRPYTVGNPHFKTVNGTQYNFQAAGEFIALRGENFELQVRQTAVGTDGPLGPDPHTGLTSSVSLTTAVAFRIGPNRITYQPMPGDSPVVKGLQLRVNGQPVAMRPEGIPLAEGAKMVPTLAPRGIRIEIPGGTAIIVTPGFWEHYQRWYLHIDTRHVRATEGLMGTISPHNWLPALPDGQSIGAKPLSLAERHKALYDTFANAWRVTDATSIFDYEPGTSTKTFTISNWPVSGTTKPCIPPAGAGGTGAKPPLKQLTLEQAKQLSAEIIDPELREHCIQDMIVTGNQDFVKTYLLTDTIRRNSPPTPPLLLSPAHQAKGLGQDVQFTWKPSTDADGDPLTYRFYLWPANTPPNNNDAILLSAADVKQSAKTVTGLKSGQSYNWRVIAEDRKWGTVESQTYRIKIK